MPLKLKQTIIFPHVPKVGGTSIKEQLEQTDLRIFFDYDAATGKGKWLQQQWERRNREYSFLDFSPFDVVFGHFPIERYLSDSFDYVALVRDPLDRAISHYLYMIWRIENRPNLDPALREQLRPKANGENDFLKFLRKQIGRDYYRRYLAYWDKSRFRLIGETGRYAEFLDKLNAILGTSLTADVHRRKREDTDFSLSEEEERKARKFLAEEYAWYEELLS